MGGTGAVALLVVLPTAFEVAPDGSARRLSGESEGFEAQEADDGFGLFRNALLTAEAGIFGGGISVA